MTMCRRCSECPTSGHHWIDNDECESETDATHACKHCDALGDECETCDGEGGRTSPDGYALALCPPCKGYGVVERGSHAEAMEAVAVIADGIRVLRTRDGVALTDAQIDERARNIAMGLMFTRLDGVRYARPVVTEDDFTQEQRIK